MIVALDAKNKLGFIDGTLPQPVLNDPLRVIWDRNNKVILAWIVRALCFEIAQSVMFITKASDLWLELKLRFAQNNHTQIADMQEELYLMKQWDMTITGFFTQLKSLWGELENFRPLSVCACGL